MTKMKCDNCGEKNDKMHTICECSKCYILGAEKERKKEQERIIEIIKKSEYIHPRVRNKVVEEVKEKGK